MNIMNTDIMIFVMEIIGTVAFAWSGAMLAIKKHLDLLGIIVLGVTTAVGGGMLRDIILGFVPPSALLNPIYISVAFFSVCALFIVVKYLRISIEILNSNRFESFLNLFDAIGLGVFTVVGVNTTMQSSQKQNILLCIFLGVLTGVGGGVIRDVMVCDIPAVLKKHIYACASLLGAILYYSIYPLIGVEISSVVCVIIVTVIRLLARHYKWNLPKAIN